MNDLEWLQAWYIGQCDGDWEHQNGVRITTLDNPGWNLHVSLEGTPWEKATLERQVVERTEQDWIHYRKEGTNFYGYGGPGNLSELVSVFREFVSSSVEGTE